MTPQARLRILNQQETAKWSAARAKAQGATKTIRLLVKPEAGKQAMVLKALLHLGAKVDGVIADQVVISLPLDKVEQLNTIRGISRIDVGRKAHMKTDVSRKETEVSYLNGPDSPLPTGIQLTDNSTLVSQLTGAGVTVCLMDIGFDYQHPAFKNADGTTRIKCIYRMNDGGGNPYVYELNDPEWGHFEYTMPGSVYDTPELIATLTTDFPTEEHGTHTASTAAGSLSPMGFCGMAPEADIVLIPLSDLSVEAFHKMNADEEESGEEMSSDDYIILALSFASAYAQQTGRPLVLSASLNSHDGPHDGTSSISEAISGISDYIIPVFSSGNEAEENNYIHCDFTAESPSLSARLTAFQEDWLGQYSGAANVNGYIRNVPDNGELSLSVSVTNPQTGDTWHSDTVIFHRYDDVQMLLVSSDDNEALATMFDGNIGIAIGETGGDKLMLQVFAEGDLAGAYQVAVNIEAPEGSQLDMWSDGGGFAVSDDQTAKPTNSCSAGDWTSGEGVISVGAYCSNLTMRFFSGFDLDFSTTEGYALNDIAPFSSFGTMLNGVNQPTVCAPGVNVVAAVNHYKYEGAPIGDNMQWQGFPYNAMSGTSMACPTVSGIVALWLQLCPTLTTEQVKDVMANSCNNDEYTAKNPLRWGLGKINAKDGADYILKSISTGIDEAQPELKLNNKFYDLQGRQLTPSQSMKPGLYIVNGKKVIKR